MSRAKEKELSRKLLDHLVPPRDLGSPEAVLATTFDLDPTFVELDLLPTTLGVASWDDNSTKGRIELEHQLALTHTVALLMEGRRYQCRPRSLRVHLTPAVNQNGGLLHAKVTLIVYAEAVRIVVGSANLTEPGYRHNREVAVAITADKKHPGETAFVAQAIRPAGERLRPWWNDEAERVMAAAEAKLREWRAEESEDEQFVWSGPNQSLLEQFLRLWPEGERINEISIVSPFWSPEQKSGPLTLLLRGLQDRGAELSKAKLRLITSAERESVSNFAPSLPAPLARFNFAAFGVTASAAAADPKIEEEDFETVTRERALHAKIVIVQGPKTALAYLGSANFTNAGWGAQNVGKANIEAGVLLRRTGKAREQLRALIPPTCREVTLDGSGAGIAVSQSDTEETSEQAFPSFIREVELRPSAANARQLELVALHVQSRPVARTGRAGDPTPPPDRSSIGQSGR